MNKTVRCRAESDGSNEYATVVELDAPNVSTKHFKQLFENFTQECLFLTDECTSSELFCTEDGLTDCYRTMVQTHKFPLLYERIVVLTIYNLFNFGAKEGTHICMQSSSGNEKFMNKQSLGEKLVDGYRVICPVSIAGYHVEPLRPDGTGVRLFYLNKSAS